MEIKELKEQISIEQIISIMRDFGVEGVPTLDGKALIYRSICHNSDSLKLYLYLETKTFYCYSHCHSMDIINLVEKVMNYTTEQSVYFIMNKIGINSNQNFKEGFDEEEPITNDDWKLVSEYYKTYKDRKEELVNRDKSLLNRFYDLYHIDFISDGISIQTMKKYHIKFDIEHNRIIIPHYDKDGNMIAIRGRNLEQSELDKGRKYIPITMNGKLLSAPTSLYFYGLNNNKDNIINSKRVIIFESEKSVMQLETMFPGSNISVALNGSSLSKYHIEILRDLGVEEVILALDKEYKVIGSKEEIGYMAKLKKKIIDRLSPLFNVSLIWDVNGLLQYKDSPSDKGKEVFMNLFNNRWFL